MKQLNRLLAAGAVLVMGAISSTAQSPLGPFATATPIPAQVTDWSGSLAFPQFNPALGTLDSVTLDFSSSLSTILTVRNTSGSGTASGNLNTEMTVSVEDGGDNFINNDPELDLSIPTYHFNLAAGQGTTSALLSVNQDSGPLSYTAPAVLSEFTGDGSFSLSASITTLADLGFNGGNTTTSQVTDASLTGTVVYNYTDPPTDVPDQTSTLALLSLGTLSLPAWDWRRRMAKAERIPPNA